MTTGRKVDSLGRANGRFRGRVRVFEREERCPINGSSFRTLSTRPGLPVEVEKDVVSWKRKQEMCCSRISSQRTETRKVSKRYVDDDVGYSNRYGRKLGVWEGALNMECWEA